jgi:hypothetical protein
LTISRLQAGLVTTFAAVSLMAGAQAAQACTEPALGDIRARATEKQLVRFELTGLTPGSEYLLRVNDRERKSGIAASDKLSRRFRMPTFGDSRRRVKVEVVVAHDGCENSPWKLEEKMTYQPAPEPQTPSAEPAPAPQASPQPAPAPSPSPPPVPAPPDPPAVDSTPAPQPAVPAPAPKPTAPAPPAPTATEPPREAKAWVTPQDPYQRAENPPLKLGQNAIARVEQPSETANSTEALIGLGGVFLLLGGTVLMAWNRFRRYDNERLHEIENPDGKLPSHLDPKAEDLAAAPEEKKKRSLIPWPGRARPAVAMKSSVPPELTAEQMATMSQEEIGQYNDARNLALRKAERAKTKAPLPTVDPAPIAGVAGAAGGASISRRQARKEKRAAAKAEREAMKARKEAVKGEGVAGQRGVLWDLTAEQKASMSQEELMALKKERKAAKEKEFGPGRIRAPLPTSDPTAPEAQAAAAAAAEQAKREQEAAKKRGLRRLVPGRDKSPAESAAPAADREPSPVPDVDPAKGADPNADRAERAAPDAAPGANGKPPPAAVPPPRVPPTNGVPHSNGAPPAGATPPPAPPARTTSPPAAPAPATQPPSTERPAPQGSHRAEVESELQRILNEAGLHAEVDGILADAKQEAQRQGVPIDSELMLKALCDEANGAAKLSDTARGELESRFKRIVAEERDGERRPSSGS